MQPLRVYLSSTCEDLKAYRDAVGLALARSGLTVARMETYVASDQRPLDLCLKDVAQCEVFVGLYAWRYGYEPPAAHGNPDACSITHLEYRQAEACGLRKLLFFAHPDTREQWPASFRDDLTGQGDGGAKLAQFRQTVGSEKTVSFFRTEDELATLVLASILRSGLSGRIYNVPSLPPGLAARTHLVDAAVAGLVDPDLRPGRNTLVQGAGGFGKTTLALLACHRPEVVQAYPDGLLWTSLGESPDVASVLGDLHVLVTGSPVAVVGVDAMAGALARALQGRQCLVAVDDVWREEDLAPFLRLNGPRLLVTTRHRALVQQTALEPWPEVSVDEMSVDEAGAMLGRGLVLDAQAEAALRDLAQRLGCWPLLLDLAAARLREERRRGRGSLAQCIAFVATLFEKKGVLGFDRRDSQARNAAVARSVDVGLELADQMAPGADLPVRAAELSIFPENQAVALHVLGELWGLDEFDVEEEVVRPLDQISLLQWDRQAGTVGLHMMIHRVLDARLKSQPGGAVAVHRRLLAAWGDPLDLPHSHAWRWLGWHCLQAGDGETLRGLLLDLDWIRARLRAAARTHDGRLWTAMTEVLHDYALLGTDEAVVEVGRALRASEVLRRDPTLLCQQLHGRLDGSRQAPSQALARMALDEITRSEALVPSWAALEPPAAVLAIWRYGHDLATGDPLLLPDGRRLLVSGAGGKSMLLDVVDDFQLLREVQLPGNVWQVLLLPDERQALYLCGTAEEGGCMEVWRWNLEQGGQPQWVTRWGTTSDWRLHAAPGGRRALITAPESGLITLVDLERDCDAVALSADFGDAAGVANLVIGSAGRRAVLYGRDLASVQCIDLMAGGLATRLERRRLPHWPPDWMPDASVIEVVFGADDEVVAVTLADPDDVLLWRPGDPAVELVGGGGQVGWVVPTPDGLHALGNTWQEDTATFSAWLLSPWPQGRRLSPEDAPQPVAALGRWPDHPRMSPDGRHMLLVSETSVTVLSWPERGMPGVEAQHRPGVWRGGATWMADARRVLLWECERRTLWCWDITRCTEPTALNGIDSGISGVLPLGDGQRVVTWSVEGSLQVWNLGVPQVAWPRAGHDGAVQGTAAVCDGGTLLTWSADGSSRLWDVETGQERLQLCVNPPDAVESAVLLQDGRAALLCTRMDHVHLADLSTGQVQPLPGMAQSGGSEDWHWRPVDDSWVILSRVDAGSDGTHSERVGRRTAGGRAALTWGDAKGYRCLLLLGPGGEAEVGWQDDELDHLYLPLDGDRLLVLTMRAIREDDELVAVEHAGWIHDLARSVEEAIPVRFEPWRSEPVHQRHGMQVIPGGPSALSWGDAGLLLAWRLDRPGPPMPLVGHDGTVLGAEALPDGQRVLSWSNDGTLRLWALESGRELIVLRSEWPIHFAVVLPGGRRVVSGGGQMVFVWDLDTATILATHCLDAEVTALSLLPDGARVFVGDEGGRVQVLRVQPHGRTAR